jgi:dienelactone hydrolase
VKITTALRARRMCGTVVPGEVDDPRRATVMRFSAETTTDGVTERLFTIGDAPGAVWAPAGAQGPRPLILLGHGGGAHSAHPSIVSRARRHVTAAGYAVAALDAPGWGGRPVPEEYQPFNAEIEELLAAGMSPGHAYARRGVVAARIAIPEWQAAIDALTALDWIGRDTRIGYEGRSLGTAIGLPLVAAEPRISAGILGLMGLPGLEEPAARLTVPVEFHLQWDDQIVPRADGLALFDAIGSEEKTLHANPGGHGDVPVFEADSSARFFARHLLGQPDRASQA